MYIFYFVVLNLNDLLYIFLQGLFFFFKQKTAYEIRLSLVGSEMCIRDSHMAVLTSGESAIARAATSASFSSAAPSTEIRAMRRAPSPSASIIKARRLQTASIPNPSLVIIASETVTPEAPLDKRNRQSFVL